MKTYTGDRTIDGVVVLVDGQPLADATDIQSLCDDGFEWGFEGPASDAALLGMSFLGQVDLMRAGNRMELKRR